MEIVERITLMDVMLSGQPTIYYSMSTCWWTHNPNHLKLTSPPTEENIRQFAENLRSKSGNSDAPLESFLPRAREVVSHRLPCDPRGSVLMQADLQSFLAAARKSADHYGRHGLRAFMAAHHSNSQKSLTDPNPWCETTWEAYNDALDRLDRRKNGESSEADQTEAEPDIAKVAATTFMGEMMRCIMCGKEQMSSPDVQSNWRCIALGSKKYFACVDEFPEDGSGVEAFKEAYMRVIIRIARLKGMKPEKLARKIKLD